MKELLQPKNIIFIILTICCIGGCRYVSHRQDIRENQISKSIDSLPTLITAQQVADAIAASQKQQYLVINYKFPRCITVDAPYGHLQGDFLYVKVSTYTEEEDKKGKKLWKSSGSTKRVIGQLFFNDGIELQSLSEASFTGVNTKTHISFNKKYEYTYILPNEPLTFIAELGQNSATLTGIESDHLMATGGKEQLTRGSSSSSMMTGIKVLLIVAAVIFMLLVVGGVMGKAQAAKDAEQRRLNRQRSKQGNKQNEWFFKKNK